MPATKPKKSKPLPTTVSDFTILPLTLPSLPGLPEFCNDAKHYVYIKPHSPTHPTPSAEKSLFVANVPVDATGTNIRAVFHDQLGGSRVERVEFDSGVPAAPLHKRWKAEPGTKKLNGGAGEEQRGKKRKRDEDVVAEGVVEDEASALPKTWGSELRRGGGAAVVVFVDKRSARGAMTEVQRAVKEGRQIKWIAGEGLGVQRYTLHNQLQHPPPATLTPSINAYLTQFALTETARTRLRKKARSEPDADGFVTVTRGGRTGPARLEHAQLKKVELDARRVKNAVKGDFYRFQTREKRKEAEGELKRRFEVDRRRVAEMRERKGRVRPEV
ncbi:ribosomal RNA-processing protein 7-domain-containing protein [Massariosphaeria phaeospora]|uniref:Ribosomal RNA-processing protein 7-domain-containing protein n=1 Tax=Massariosphaeria phaeospora TaxID=100035 RepID=A0A7C8I1Y9_9PLEO|nr:ribosomal RNA-processing protein 7-domain-containing protein [Massariosphaeria phaeospora]